LIIFAFKIYIMKKYGRNTRYRVGHEKICIVCGRHFISKYKNRKFCSDSCYFKYRRLKERGQLDKIKNLSFWE